MIQGHGDDAYRYPDVRINFSSNIYSHVDLADLKAFLVGQIDVIGRYPEPEPYSLASTLARFWDIPADCILVTNGATDAIYLIAQMLVRQGFRRRRIPQPTFSEYADACDMFGLEPTDADGTDVATWLCNPNNPTGEVRPTEALKAEGMLVVDQSYEDYTLQPLLSPRDVVRRERLIQIHSLTKTYAIPGLRIGYVVASAQVIAQLRACVRPWAVNALAVEAGRWLVEHHRPVVPCLSAYLDEAQRLNRRLNALPHVEAMPTATNFMLARIDCCTATQLKERLARQYGLLIRDASNFAGLDAHYFRVAAQSPAEDDCLVEAIGQLAALPGTL